MPSSASYTESQTESQSSRGPHITQWLPQLALASLTFLAVASIIGVSLSAVAFSTAGDVRRPGHGVAQSFVMFASIHSLFYIPLHLLACRKGDGLYFDSPIPSFRHQLHAWAALVIRTTVALWASASVPVAVGIYRGGGNITTLNLKANIFACATGLLFSAVILAVLQFARRPFTLPWLSPGVFDEEDDAGEFDKFDDKTTSASSGSSTDGGILRGSPPTSKGSIKVLLLPPSDGTTTSSSRSTASTTGSRSGSRSRRRARNKMTRTRRYILEEMPTPVSVSPPPLKTRVSGEMTDGSVSLDGSSGAGYSSPSSSTRSGGTTTPATTISTSGGGGGSPTPASTTCSSEAGTGTGDGGGSVKNSKLRGGVGMGVDREKSGGYFAAAAAVTGCSPKRKLAEKKKGVGVRVRERPVTPVRGGNGPQRGGKVPTAVSQRRAGESPSLFRFGRKTHARPHGGGGGGVQKGNVGEGGGDPPPPPPPPVPAPTYYVPGAWMPRGQSDEGAVGEV